MSELNQPTPETPAIVVEIPPYGRMRIFDHSGAGVGALSFFQENWLVLWPKVRHELEAKCEYYGALEELKAPVWNAEGEWLEPDVRFSDEANLFLAIRMQRYRRWDFFIKDTDIVHCQPT